MADNDDVIINLQGDTSTTLVKAEEGKTGAGSVSFNDDDGDPVADLKKQFSAMSGQLRTVVAEGQATKQQLDDTHQRLQRAESQVVTSQLGTVESGIAAAEAEAQQAEQAYTVAFEAGDGAAMARAQRLIARSEGNLQRLTEAREDLKDVATRKGAGGDPNARQAPQRRQAADPVEATAATLSAKSAAWVRAHPECITDPRMNARMMAAHNLAVADDVALDSEEYFQRIEDGVKMKKSTPEPDGGGKGDGRRPSSGAAPGGGSGGGLNGGTTVKLTAGEALSATDGTLQWNYDDPTGQNRFKKGDPIGLAEMARRKHEGKKAGLYDKSSFEV